MRAAVLRLRRLTHPLLTERRRHTRLHRPKRMAAPHAVVTPHAVATPTFRHDPPTDQRSTGSLIVQRVRNAGGPVDNASYTCACGFVFAASVSTTVRCPHCGASQAW
jgi:hypothetical protein